MKLTTHIFIQRLLCLFICFISATIAFGQNNDFQHLKDSLLKVIASTQGEERLKAYKTLVDSDQSFQLSEEDVNSMLQYISDYIHEARKQKNKKHESSAYRIELRYLHNSLRSDEFKQKANEYLPFFKGNGDNVTYYQFYSALLRVNSLGGNYERCIQGAKQMYEEAKQENDLYGITEAVLLLASIYSAENRYEDAEKYFRETIDNALKLIPSKDSNSHRLASDGYDGLAIVLLTQGKIDEFSSLMSDWKKLLTAFEKTFGYPSPSLRDYYMKMTYIYLAKGEYNKAELYCDSMIPTLSGNVDLHHLYEIKVQIYYGCKEYDKAIDWNDKNIKLSTDFGELAYTVSLLKNKAQILKKMGRMEESYSVLEMAFLRNDSLHQMETNAQLDEIRTQYEVDKHIAEKEHNFNYFLFAIGGCILLAIALAIWMFYSRKITRKNRILAQQIKESTAQQEKQINEMLEKISFEEIDPYLCIESRMDKLCIAIRDLLLKDKIYRDSSITQEIMVRQLGTNKNLFTQAMLYCFGMKFNDYVNFLRLKDAVQLLEQSDLSIIEISDKVGFGVVSTFRRQFSAKYDMTPTDYRNLTKKPDGHPERS
ncbi:MAG: AraC family transcriptional regulator [Dysgonamonadaceae bacterium]|jgi:AraC-like DNA-binding protein|nr:AraC family transcriptional regulator [Dysgonamonadaceae bacterium]